MSFDRFKSKILNPTSAVLTRLIGSSVWLISGSVRTWYHVLYQISIATLKVVNTIIPPPLSNISKTDFKELENIKPISYFASKSNLESFEIRPDSGRNTESFDWKDSPIKKTSIRTHSYWNKRPEAQNSGQKNSPYSYNSFKPENQNTISPQKISKNYGKRKEEYQCNTPIRGEACQSPYIFSNNNSFIFPTYSSVSMFEKEEYNTENYCPQFDWENNECYQPFSEYSNEPSLIFSENNQSYSLGFYSDINPQPFNQEIRQDHNDEGTQRKRFKARRMLSS